MTYLSFMETDQMNVWNSAECEVCHKLVPRDGLLAHYNLHNLHGNRAAPQKKTFPCELCGTTFITRQVLERHEQCRHRPLKPFACGQCRGRHFVNKGALIQHLYRKHFRSPTQQELEHRPPQASCPACNIPVVGSPTHMLKHRIISCRCRSLLQKRHMKRISRLAVATGIDPLRYVSLELEAWLVDRMTSKAQSKGCSVMVSPGGCYRVVKPSADENLPSVATQHMPYQEEMTNEFACQNKDMDDIFVSDILGERSYDMRKLHDDGMSLEDLEHRQMNLLYLIDMWDQDIVKNLGPYDLRTMEKLEKLSSRIYKKPYKVAQRLSHSSVRNSGLLSELTSDGNAKQTGNVVLPSVIARLDDELKGMLDQDDQYNVTIPQNLAMKLEQEANLVDSLIESKKDTKVNLMDVLMMRENLNIML